MAYQRPKQWGHGDTVSAADMNKYSDSLNFLEAALPSAQWNPAQLWSYENFSITHAGSDYYFVHRKRYLIYRGDGEIVDPIGSGTSVDIAGDGTSILAYDLDSVPWLTRGKIFQVKDCVFALEDDEGL